MLIRAMLIRAMSIRAMLIRAMLIRAMPVRTMPIRTELIRHLVRSAPCGMPSRLVSHVPDNFGLPTFLKTANTEHQHAQI